MGSWKTVFPVMKGRVSRMRMQIVWGPLDPDPSQEHEQFIGFACLQLTSCHEGGDPNRLLTYDECVWGVEICV